MKMKLIAMLVSVTTIVTSGIMIGVKNSEETLIGNESTNKTSEVRLAKEEEQEKLVEEKQELVKKVEKQEVAEGKEQEITEKKEQEKTETKKEEKNLKEQNKEKSTAKQNSNQTKSSDNESKKSSNQQQTHVDTTYEDVKVRDKYEDGGKIIITTREYIPIASGYATTYRYAIVDTAKCTITIKDHTEIFESVWNLLSDEERLAEGSRVQEDVYTYEISEDEINRLLDIYEKIDERIDLHDEVAFSNYINNMENITSNYYYIIDGDYADTEMYVFDNESDVEFLYNLLNK